MARQIHDDLELATELQQAGIPLHEDVLDRMRLDRRGLSIYQTGTIPENEIFDLGSSMGVMISLAIYNDAPTNIHIAQFRLEIPWLEPQFRWLQDPLRKSPREDLYCFPVPSLLAFEREVVLNHRIGPQGLLLPGDCLEGLLLGVGESSIPENYRNRQSLDLQLRVIDSLGRQVSSTLKMCVDRKKPGRHQFEQDFGVGRTPRRKLFESPDRLESRSRKRAVRIRL
jgi:hypothetical protein